MTTALSRSPVTPAGMEAFAPATRQWFFDALETPTPIQRMAWPVLAERKSALLLAPTGSGKTLAAFMAAIDRLMFSPPAGIAEAPAVQGPNTDSVDRKPGRKSVRRAKEKPPGTRVLYVSPLKALAVDVDRNLRSPLAGIEAIAQREGIPFTAPRVAIRSGDTSSDERRLMLREPPDILITTPESLYLLLTAKSRESLVDVDTVIVDEIHAIAATKRGVHFFATLERLERLRRQRRPDAPPLQRIGLSATQRPLEEMARLLGGADVEAAPDSVPRWRPVEIVDASEPKRLSLRIETPVEDMANLARPLEVPSGDASAGPRTASIWPSIHPRLVELIRERRSTMIFVNSRRLAERLAAAINELAEEELAQAHHGSIARATRVGIEDRLKRGQLRAIVATSSMELGIDMGAVDLVIQIEAPPSVASGLQRIGRASHHVGGASEGVIFPKYRGDLLASSAAARRILRNEVESTRYPRNALDIVAQQVVAMVALEPAAVDEAFATLRAAAPFHDLPRSLFDDVLDMLSGRYPSDEFAELRPRITWDRLAGTIAGRKGAQRLAILNGGAIPDRGLYGVFLAGEAGTPGRRVGELDEEMVFETHAGDVFLLGASSWRVLEITRDRVIVAPAPGEPGKMPFWRGDGPGRPLEFGRAIGRLTRQVDEGDASAAAELLKSQCGLDRRASQNLLQYLADQRDAIGHVPTDETIVIESFVDELGDWRTVVLSPFGSRVHAPWAIAAAARLRAEAGVDVDFSWADDGMTFRIPQSDRPPGQDQMFPASDEVEDQVVRELGSTALFAARFRENAARALLLPRRYPQHRTPLWMQRRRSADLLAVASRFERFPMMLETYRECLRDVFDLPGLRQLLSEVERRQIRVVSVETGSPSPFAGSLLFNNTANYIYQGDAPLAERRAAALVLDHAQLRELLGVADYRRLLDAHAVDSVALELARLDRKGLTGPDAIHDLLLHLGDLDESQLAERTPDEYVASGDLARWIEELLGARRAFRVRIAGERRLAAAEDAGRLRDALGVALPPGLPDAFLERGENPLAEIVARYARTHGPFRAAEAAARFGLGESVVLAALAQLAQRSRVVQGEFLPGGAGEEWCDASVLRRIKSRSLALVRKQIEPVPPEALARLLPAWQGVERPRRGLDGLLDAIESLQGAPAAASDFDELILPARVADFQSSDLDELCAAGEIVWRGVDSLGSTDGRIALFLTDQVPLLAPPPTSVYDETADKIRELLASRGALFFDDIVAQVGGFPHDLLQALWNLVWAGHATNDTFAPLRSLRRGSKPARRRDEGRPRRRDRKYFRSRRMARSPGSEGRWSLISYGDPAARTATQRQTAVVEQLLKRYGLLVRSAVGRELVEGGFAALYPVLRAMEEAGKVRRGYFVEGLGGAQFAAAGADDLLRGGPRASDGQESKALVLGAADPASAYGSILKWPAAAADAAPPQRAAGARVVLLDGKLLAFLGRSGRQLATFPPDDPADAAAHRAKLAGALAGLARPGAGVLIETVDGQPAAASPLAEELLRRGFSPVLRGLLRRVSFTPERIGDHA